MCVWTISSPFHTFIRFVSHFVYDIYDRLGSQFWVIRITDGVQSKIKPKQQLCTARSPYLHTSTLTHSRRPATTEPRKTGHNRHTNLHIKPPFSVLFQSAQCVFSFPLLFILGFDSDSVSRKKKEKKKLVCTLNILNASPEELHFVCEQCWRIILDIESLLRIAADLLLFFP